MEITELKKISSSNINNDANEMSRLIKENIMLKDENSKLQWQVSNL